MRFVLIDRILDVQSGRSRLAGSNTFTSPAPFLQNVLMSCFSASEIPSKQLRTARWHVRQRARRDSSVIAFTFASRLRIVSV